LAHRGSVIKALSIVELMLALNSWAAILMMVFWHSHDQTGLDVISVRTIATALDTESRNSLTLMTRMLQAGEGSRHHCIHADRHGPTVFAAIDLMYWPPIQRAHYGVPISPAGTVQMQVHANPKPAAPQMLSLENVTLP